MRNSVCDIVGNPITVQFRYWLIVPLATAVIAGVWLAADGRHHMDEPTYFYSGLYQSTEQIIAGQVQPSGIPHFTQGRILHALLVKGVMSVSGTGLQGYRALLAINLMLIVVAIALAARILHELIPDVPTRRTAVALLAMTPVVLFLLLKILADTEGLVAALAATYAMLRYARGGSVYLACIAIVGLAIAALSKNQMIVLPATFWMAICIVPIAGVDRRRLAVFGVVCGIAGILLTLAILEFLGIGLTSYLSSYLGLAEGKMAPIAKAMNIGTEFGVLWLLLPFAFLTPRRRELRAFGLWFLLAMAPFAFFINSVEARHVAVNLVAAGGLFALALETLANRNPAWGRLSEKSRCGAALLAILVIMSCNAIVLAIMSHRVDLNQLRIMLATLDNRYGAGQYALLTANGYTDFQIVRVLWPQVDVRDVSTAEIAVHEGFTSRKDGLDSYLGDRHHESVEELRAVEKPLVYLGYGRTFAADNLRAMVSTVSPHLADTLLSKIAIPDRMSAPSTRWLWQDRDVHLEPIAHIGHYFTYEVQIAPKGASE